MGWVDISSYSVLRSSRRVHTLSIFPPQLYYYTVKYNTSSASLSPTTELLTQSLASPPSSTWNKWHCVGRLAVSKLSLCVFVCVCEQTELVCVCEQTERVCVCVCVCVCNAYLCLFIALGYGVALQTWIHICWLAYLTLCIMVCWKNECFTQFKRQIIYNYIAKTMCILMQN